MNKKILTAVIFILLIIPIIGTALANHAQAGMKIVLVDPIEQGVKNTGQSAGYYVDESGKPKSDFATAFIKYANGMTGMIGILFMILTIYGGWLWMTAQGNDEQVSKGKKIIIGAAIGLGVILGARIIVEFAINNIPTSL